MIAPTKTNDIYFDHKKDVTILIERRQFTPTEYSVSEGYLSYLNENFIKRVVMHDSVGIIGEYRLTKKGTLKLIK